MAKNKTNKKIRRLLILISIFIVFVIIYFLLLANKFKQDISNYQTKVNYQNTTQNKETVFTSGLGKFSVVVPEGFTTGEKYTSTFIKGKGGEIMIDIVGTNYEDLNSYLDYHAKRNNLLIMHKQQVKIENNNAIKAVLVSSSNNSIQYTAYFIYPTAWTIYTLSTDSEVLYADLDKIANSFRYLP
jgi:cell division protein FtsB